MKTINELEEKITKITIKIQKEFPELSQYISEMPKIDSDNDELNIKNLEHYYNSLKDILNNNVKNYDLKSHPEIEKTAAYAEDFSYPQSEDIYKNSKQETEINPDNISKKKSPNSENPMNEKNFKEDMSGDDLDIPGSELDDQQEKIGSEDEENNYYSLGGDNHNDLEEDKG